MQAYPFGGGWLEVVVGPMFSGKSEELIRRVTRAVLARQSVQVFKPAMDDRYDPLQVASHAGRTVHAEAVRSSSEVRGRVRDTTQVVAVDEAQFFDTDLPRLAEDLADEGLRVIVAGLDLDFRGEPFGPLPTLLARAEAVEKLTAICGCGRAATRTQRLIGGHPAHYDDPVILVGAHESYEPRCRACHRVPRRERATPLFAQEAAGA